jgi:hypothetical protein
MEQLSTRFSAIRISDTKKRMCGNIRLPAKRYFDSAVDNRGWISHELTRYLFVAHHKNFMLNTLIWRLFFASWLVIPSRCFLSLHLCGRTYDEVVGDKNKLSKLVTGYGGGV